MKEILTNREIIAVDQDSLGMQGRRVTRDRDREVWAKQLADGGRAVVLFNRGPNSQEISVSWTEIGYPQQLQAQVRDLWAHKDLGKFTGKFSAEVPSHGVVMVTIKP
jgi:alpha-galactosidase